MKSVNRERLESLSNIADAKPYDEVWELFAVLDNFDMKNIWIGREMQLQPWSLLREDEVSSASENSKRIILENTPQLSDDNQVVL